MNKAFFIDKDGVIVDNSKYPDVIPTHKILKNKIIKGLKHIKNKGYKIIIISNQPWISKNRLSLEETHIIFKTLLIKLKNLEIEIDGYFFCPHQSSDNCECKKPSPKMILQAAKKHNIDLKNSFMVGDMRKDILAGKNAGTKTILVLTGRGKDFINNGEDYIIKNLNEIKKII